MTLDELQKLCERVQDDYWQRDPWEVAESCLKLIAVARAATACFGDLAPECDESEADRKRLDEALAALES